MSKSALLTRSPCFSRSDSLGSLYRPDNVIGNDEGSGNCYAKAFHTEGPDIADQVLENVRKEARRLWSVCCSRASDCS